MWIAGNRYDVRELNGALGDLGTLIPFVLGYITSPSGTCTRAKDANPSARPTLGACGYVA